MNWATTPAAVWTAARPDQLAAPHLVQINRYVTNQSICRDLPVDTRVPSFRPIYQIRGIGHASFGRTHSSGELCGQKLALCTPMELEAQMTGRLRDREMPIPVSKNNFYFTQKG